MFLQYNNALKERGGGGTRAGYSIGIMCGLFRTVMIFVLIEKYIIIIIIITFMLGL